MVSNSPLITFEVGGPLFQYGGTALLVLFAGFHETGRNSSNFEPPAGVPRLLLQEVKLRNFCGRPGMGKKIITDDTGFEGTQRCDQTCLRLGGFATPEREMRTARGNGIYARDHLAKAWIITATGPKVLMVSVKETSSTLVRTSAGVRKPRSDVLTVRNLGKPSRDIGKHLDRGYSRNTIYSKNVLPVRATHAYMHSLHKRLTVGLVVDCVLMSQSNYD